MESDFSANSKDHYGSVYESFRPFYYTLKFFGFLSFRLDCKSKTFKVKTVDVLWTVIWFLWTISLLAFNIYFGQDGITEKSTIVRVGLVYLLGFELIGCCFVIIYNYRKRTSIQKYMNYLKEFDDECFQMKYRPNHKLRQKSSYFIIFGGMSSIVLLVIIVNTLRHISGDEMKTKRECTLMLSYFHIAQCYVLCCFQFIFPACSLRGRFIILNRNIESYFMECLCLNNEKKIHLIKKFAIMHDKLNDAIDVVNSTFAIELVPGIVFALIMYMFSMYSLFQIILNYKGSALTAFANSLWGFHFFIFMIICIRISASATRHGMKTGQIIHKIINKNDDPNFVQKLLAFSIQIKNRPPEFSCNFFKIDWSLLLSIIATSTTYLVIVLQADGHSTLSTDSYLNCTCT